MQPVRRKSTAGLVTKSGVLVDGTHVGVFEEDLADQGAGKDGKAFDMTEFLEKLREEAEQAFRRD